MPCAVQTPCGILCQIESGMLEIALPRHMWLLSMFARACWCSFSLICFSFSTCFDSSFPIASGRGSPAARESASLSPSSLTMSSFFVKKVN